MIKDKILIDVQVPAIEKSFNCYISKYSRINEVVNLIGFSLSNLTKKTFVNSKDLVLCDSKTGSIFNNNLRVSDTDLKNGSEVIIV